jgi:hypothetical protein
MLHARRLWHVGRHYGKLTVGFISTLHFSCPGLVGLIARTGIERNSQAAYLFPCMATVLRRLLTLFLAAAFFVGATVQVLPSSAALADVGIHSDKMAGRDGASAAPLKPVADCDGPGVPPAKPMANCIDHFGCLTVPALATAPTAPPTPFRWVSITYISGATSLIGRSVEPELSPPILAV